MLDQQGLLDIRHNKKSISNRCIWKNKRQALNYFEKKELHNSEYTEWTDLINYQIDFLTWRMCRLDKDSNRLSKIKNVFMDFNFSQWHIR